MKAAILIFISIGFFLSGKAQSGRQFRPLYDEKGGPLHTKGWFFAPGITYMLPSPFSRDINQTVLPDTALHGTYEARGKIGLYLEVGHAHFLPYWVPIDYIDYGLSFKLFRGKEAFTGDYRVPETETILMPLSSNSKFSEGYAAASVNFGKLFQTGDYSFILASLGLNADYRVLSNREADFAYLPSVFPDNLLIQAHAKIGYGFKLQSNLFVIPSLETPILNVLPFEEGKSTLPYFASRYRPLILSIRFQWLSARKPEDCVGKPTEKRGHELWDPAMRKKNKRKG